MANSNVDHTYYLSLNISESSYDATTNISKYSYSLYLYTGGKSFEQYSCAGILYVNGGAVWNAADAGQLTLYYPNSLLLASGSNLDYTHAADGTGSLSASITNFGTNTKGSNAQGVQYTPDKVLTVSATGSITNIARVPAAPTASVTRSGTGSTITVTSSVATAAGGTPTPPAITDYQYRWSTDNATWQTAVSIGTGRTGTFGASSPTTVLPTQVYYFQTRAYNGDTGVGNNPSNTGYSAWSASTVAYAAPSITSASSVGTTATVVLAAPASDGGAAINAATGYTIEYSTDSTFATGTTVVTGRPVGTNTFTGISPGNTYYFRAKYVNAASVTSPYSASASTFIAAYGRRYFTSGSITNVTSNAKVKTITSVFGTEFTTRFTTSTAHGFVAGENVVVSGIAAPYDYLNGTKPNIEVYTSTSFSTDANSDGLGTVSISGTATVTGTELTYTASNSFSAGDTVTITGVTSTSPASAFNLTGATIKSATSSQFVITSSASGTYSSSTGTASGWARMLSGKRYDANGTSPGVPGWTVITTVQKYTAGAWTPFS